MFGTKSKMATLMALKSSRLHSMPGQLAHSPAFRGIHTSTVVCKKTIRAGRYKVSRDQSVELTYEEAKGPSLIGVEKAWSSWNTSNLKNEGRKSETTIEDSFIRNFITGTWHSLVLSQIIIKRRHNMMNIAFIADTVYLDKQKIYFLVGYTEELLSCLLKCCVKLEVQGWDANKSLTFKYI